MQFQYYMPVRLVCGRDCVRERADLFSGFGKKALIVTGKSSAKNGALADTEAALSANGQKIHPLLSEEWKCVPENESFRSKTLECSLREDGSAEFSWENCREIPLTDGWFETVWSDYRSKRIYGAS